MTGSGRPFPGGYQPQLLLLFLGKNLRFGMKAVECANEIIPLLLDDDIEIRGHVAIALVEMGKKDSVLKDCIIDILPALQRRGEATRAVSVLRTLGVPDKEIELAMDE